MTAHLCREFNPSCYRCDLSRDEIPEPCVTHDFSWFDRVPCPEPCGWMHTLCVNCHESLEPCLLP